jgi:sarcosine dehydrogenase
VYQERLGWERPGWFAIDSKAEINEYDYYGAYENERKISKYEELLTNDYTFDFPQHHDIVRKKRLYIFILLHLLMI